MPTIFKPLHTSADLHRRKLHEIIWKWIEGFAQVLSISIYDMESFHSDTIQCRIWTRVWNSVVWRRGFPCIHIGSNQLDLKAISGIWKRYAQVGTFETFDCWKWNVWSIHLQHDGSIETEMVGLNSVATRRINNNKNWELREKLRITILYYKEGMYYYLPRLLCLYFLGSCRTVVVFLRSFRTITFYTNFW